MIVVDTSAFVAALREEDDAKALLARMVRAGNVLMSAATKLELGIVIYARFGQEGLDRSDDLLDTMKAQVVSVDETQSALAIDAYKRFGRGTGHPARLNFGDCFSYALAKSLDLPLLFKGDDFVHTDIRPALATAP